MRPINKQDNSQDNNPTSYTFIWSAILTTKGIGLGFLNPSFFFKL
jgi:hypothetical protein